MGNGWRHARGCLCGQPWQPGDHPGHIHIRKQPPSSWPSWPTCPNSEVTEAAEEFWLLPTRLKATRLSTTTGSTRWRDSKPKVKSLQISRSPSVPSVFLADQCNKVLGQISDRVNQVAVAFMLGHDYGFKRIMSSYYFQDTDQVLNNQQKSCFKSSNMIVILTGPTWWSACFLPKCLRERVDLWAQVVTFPFDFDWKDN